MNSASLASDGGAKKYSQLFIASGTWAVPAGVTVVELVGIGCGGSAEPGSGFTSSGGGGSSSLIHSYVRVTPSTTITVTVGGNTAGTYVDTTFPGGASGDDIIIPKGGAGVHSGAAPGGAAGIPAPEKVGQLISIWPGLAGGAGSMGGAGSNSGSYDASYSGVQGGISAGLGGPSGGGRGGGGGGAPSYFSIATGSGTQGSQGLVAGAVAPPANNFGAGAAGGGVTGSSANGARGFIFITWMV